MKKKMYTNKQHQQQKKLYQSINRFNEIINQLVSFLTNIFRSIKLSESPMQMYRIIFLEQI